MTEPHMVLKDIEFREALECLCTQGRRLAESFHFDFPASILEAAFRLCLESREVPALVAIVGGASSGKSTVFDNLLGGRNTSRVTARGHSTRGLILAVHHRHREALEGLLARRELLPNLRQRYIELDEDTTGEADVLNVTYHGCDALAGSLVFDTPDFTSQLARLEGDVTLRMLPWFDRLIVLVDHERWFDKQAVSQLRAESARFGQERFVLFNRTKEGPLAASEVALLGRQAERLGASGMQILEFRRGRGLCLFPPNAFDDLIRFLDGPRPQRTSALLRQTADAAARVLNQNAERAARLSDLQADLRAVVDRCLPTARQAMIAMMTRRERSLLDPFERILRLDATRTWLSAQGTRLKNALDRVPLLGSSLAVRAAVGEGASSPSDRDSAGLAFFDAAVSRQVHEIQRVTQGSTFWEEIEHWTEQRPAAPSPHWAEARRDSVRAAIRAFDDAMVRWNAKVEAECVGVAPNIKGAFGAGLIALAIVLVAVPGPVTALTLIAAKGAVAAAVAQVATVAGLGALLGKQVGRLTEIIRERLLGGAEFSALQGAAAAYRGLIESAGRDIAAAAQDEASALVLAPDDPLATALEPFRKVTETRP